MHNQVMLISHLIKKIKQWIICVPHINPYKTTDVILKSAELKRTTNVNEMTQIIKKIDVAILKSICILTKDYISTQQTNWNHFICIFLRWLFFLEG